MRPPPPLEIVTELAAAPPMTSPFAEHPADPLRAYTPSACIPPGLQDSAMGKQPSTPQSRGHPQSAPPAGPPNLPPSLLEGKPPPLSDASSRQTRLLAAPPLTPGACIPPGLQDGEVPPPTSLASPQGGGFPTSAPPPTSPNLPASLLEGASRTAPSDTSALHAALLAGALEAPGYGASALGHLKGGAAGLATSAPAAGMGGMERQHTPLGTAAGATLAAAVGRGYGQEPSPMLSPATAPSMATRSPMTSPSGYAPPPRAGAAGSAATQPLSVSALFESLTAASKPTFEKLDEALPPSYPSHLDYMSRPLPSPCSRAPYDPYDRGVAAYDASARAAYADLLNRAAYGSNPYDYGANVAAASAAAASEDMYRAAAAAAAAGAAEASGGPRHPHNPYGQAPGSLQHWMPQGLGVPPDGAGSRLRVDSSAVAPGPVARAGPGGHAGGAPRQDEPVDWEGVEMLQALFPNTRISVKSAAQQHPQNAAAAAAAAASLAAAAAGAGRPYAAPPYPPAAALGPGGMLGPGGLFGAGAGGRMAPHQQRGGGQHDPGPYHAQLHGGPGPGGMGQGQGQGQGRRRRGPA